MLDHKIEQCESPRFVSRLVVVFCISIFSVFLNLYAEAFGCSNYTTTCGSKVITPSNLSSGAYICGSPSSINGKVVPYTLGWSSSCAVAAGGTTTTNMSSCMDIPNLFGEIVDTFATAGIAVAMRSNFCSFAPGDNDIEGGIITSEFLSDQCDSNLSSSDFNKCHKYLMRGYDMSGYAGGVIAPSSSDTGAGYSGYGLNTMDENTLNGYTTSDVCAGIPNVHKPVLNDDGHMVFDSSGNQVMCPMMRCNIPTNYIMVKYSDKAIERIGIITAAGAAVSLFQPELAPLFAVGTFALDIASAAAGNMCDSGSITSEKTVGYNFMKLVRIKGDIQGDKICAKVLFGLSGWTTLACKSMVPPQIEMNYTTGCQLSQTSCADATKSKSKAFFPFTAKMMQCVTELLNQVFVASTCNGITNPIVNFQQNMRGVIKTLLVLYVIIVGIRVAFGEGLTKKDFWTFILKIILVTYFAVGTVGGTNEDGKASDTGLQTLGKLAFTGMSSFSGMVIGNDTESAESSGQICAYPDSIYDDGYSYLGLWDSLDCRLAYYLAIASPTSMGKSLMQIPLLNTVGGLFSYVWGAFFSFNFIFLVFSLCFGIFVLSMIISFVHLYILATIAIFIMIFMAPIFIPCALFERTKGYFDSWLKLIMGYALQPVVVVAFLALVFSVFDGIIYKGCSFSYSALPNSSPYWEIDDPNSASSNYSAVDKQNCLDSFGYLLAQSSSGKHLVQDSFGGLFTFYKIQQYSSGTQWWSMIKSMMLGTFFAFLFYYFAKQLHSFAADVSMSGSLGAMSPNAGIDAVGKAAEMALDAQTGGKYSQAKGAAQQATGGSPGGGVSVSKAPARKGIQVSGGK